MEVIEINKNTITYRGTDYLLNGYEIIDSTCLHLFLDQGIYAITLPCVVNGEEISIMEILTDLL